MIRRLRKFIVLPVCMVALIPAGAIYLGATIGTTPKLAAVRPEDSVYSRLDPQALFVRPDIDSNMVQLAFAHPSYDRNKGLEMTFRGVVGRNLSSLRFDQVLARHEIELKSDPNEMMNVELAAEAVDNVLVMPGETFSFNNQVGIRSEEKGYKPGLMFQQGQVIKGIGGGVCLVSTGLYNAALEAGLKIVERNQHSGIPRYAGPGFDAAVVYGTLDLKIKNDTPTPVLIRSKIEDDSLVLAILGHQNAKTEVVLETANYQGIPFKIFQKPDPSVPEGQVVVKQSAKPGCECDTIRIIKRDGKTADREVVAHSRYSPRNKIMLIPMPAQVSSPEGTTAQPTNEQPKPVETKQADIPGDRTADSTD